MLMQLKETRQLSVLTFIFSFSVNKNHGIEKNLSIKNKLVKQCFVQNENTYGFFAFQKIF
jgi:hypothetical protein